MVKFLAGSQFCGQNSVCFTLAWNSFYLNPERKELKRSCVWQYAHRIFIYRKFQNPVGLQNPNRLQNFIHQLTIKLCMYEEEMFWNYRKSRRQLQLLEAWQSSLIIFSASFSIFHFTLYESQSKRTIRKIEFNQRNLMNGNRYRFWFEGAKTYSEIRWFLCIN